MKASSRCQELLLILLTVSCAVHLIAQEREIIHEAFSERAPSGPKRVTNVNPIPMSLHLPGSFQKGVNICELEEVTAEELAFAEKTATERAAGIKPGPLRTGLARSIGPKPLSMEGGSVALQEMGGGTNLWTFSLRSVGAFALRVHFLNLNLNGGLMRVYAYQGDQLIVRGPYTQAGPNRNGNFWTETLPGDTVFVEITGAGQPRFEVPEVLHFDRKPWGNADLGGGAANALSCELDVMCQTDPPVNPDSRDAVGQLNFVSGRASYVCTGTLLTDLDPETTLPYLLTANHCIGSQAEADTLEVVYLWQSAACGGTLPNYLTLPRSNGGLLINHSSDNDRSFIRLNGEVPAGVTLAGWTTASPSDGLMGIHHPGGDYKRCYLMDEVPDADGYVILCGLDITEFDFYYAERGLMEPGASGSGIFIASTGQLFGQLYGNCGDAPNCDNRLLWRAAYGEFEETYPSIRRWLEIGGTIHVDKSYSGTEQGTPSQPYKTIGAANNFAWSGARIKIKASSYPETVTFNKQLTLLAEGGAVTIGR